MSHRRPPGRNEGSKLLNAACEPRTVCDVARQIGVSPSAISRYRSGERIPGFHERFAMERAFGIGMHSWDRPIPVAKVPPVNEGARIVDVDVKEPRARSSAA